jgi:hypothetical protein
VTERRGSDSARIFREIVDALPTFPASRHGRFNLRISGLRVSAKRSVAKFEGHHDAWKISGTVVVMQSGEVSITSVNIEGERNGGITSDVLRALPLGELRQDLLTVVDGTPRTLSEALASPRRPRKVQRGRPKLSDEMLLRVAAERVRLSRDGYRGAINTELSRRLADLSEYEIPVSTVESWLRMARERGFLSEGRRGSRTASFGPRFRLAAQNEGM